MINDNIIQAKRPSDVTKKYFLNWILVAELLRFMKRFREKIKNDDVFVKYWRERRRMTPPATPFVGDSGMYSRIIFIYVALVSLLFFLSILLNVDNENTSKCEIYYS